MPVAVELRRSQVVGPRHGQGGHRGVCRNGQGQRTQADFFALAIGARVAGRGKADVGHQGNGRRIQGMVRPGWLQGAARIEGRDFEALGAHEQQGRIGADQVDHGAADQPQRVAHLVGLEQLAREAQQHAQLGRVDLLGFHRTVPPSSWPRAACCSGCSPGARMA